MADRKVVVLLLSQFLMESHTRSARRQQKRLDNIIDALLLSEARKQKEAANVASYCTVCPVCVCLSPEMCLVSSKVSIK